MKIENIIFDIDGVLLDTNQIDVNFLNKVRGQNLVFKELKEEFSVGFKTKTLYIPFNSKEQYHIWQELYYSNPVINQDAWQIIQNLSSMGYKMFTMSSAAAENWPKKAKLINELFDGKVIPRFAEGGDKTPYLLSLVDEFNLNPKQTLFIDDSVVAVRQGKAAKFQSARMIGNGTMPSPKNLRVPHFTNFEQVQDFVVSSR